MTINTDWHKDKQTTKTLIGSGSNFHEKYFNPVATYQN